MIITPVTFDGHALNSSDYETCSFNLSSQPAAKPVFVDNANADSNYSGGYSVDVRNCVIGIRITDYANRHELVDQLKGWFQRGTEGDLIATHDIDGEDYRLACVVQSLVQDASYPDHFTAILQSGQSAWISVDRDEDTWEATNATKTKTITVEGTEGVETQLNMEILPTVAPGSGYFYQKLLQIVGTTINFGIRPWCVTIDTAALVTAGKMRADCYDLRVFVGTTEYRRWIADPNTNHTHLWFNAPLGPSSSLTLKTALDDTTDPGILEFVVNATSRAVINAMPYQGIIFHGTEWFSYQGKNPDTGTLFIQQRGAYGTTLQAHVAAVTFQTIQNAVFVYYGNPAADNPSSSDSQYDETKPVFNLSTSDNTAWLYDATSLFVDPAHPARPGQWSSYNNGGNGPNSHLYHIKEDAASGDPALGMVIGPYVGSNGKWWPINAGLFKWLFGSPGGIASVVLTGEKKDTVGYTAGSSWPQAGFGFYSDADPYYWLHATWLVAPTGTWSAWSISVTTAGYPNILLAMQGQVVGQGGGSYMEMLTATITFTSANTPAATLLAEKANYPLSIGILNTENGDQINLLFPMILDNPILLDSEEKTALYHGINCHGSIELNDESRAVWVRLITGDNDLEIVAADVGTVQISLSWNRRRL